MPAPIIRKINNLGSRIILGSQGSPTNGDWSKNVVSGDIKNLFDGDTSTEVEITSGFCVDPINFPCPGSNGFYDRYITFDLGKPTTLDRIVLLILLEMLLFYLM